MKREHLARFRTGLAVLAATVGTTALAAEMELEWTFPDGRREIERRDLPEKDGVSTFALTRAEITAKKAKSLALTPSFARAKKGDEGFWVFSDGEYGTFRCDKGTASCSRWQLMSLFGMKTPERTFVALVRGLKYYFTSRVSVTNGRYKMSCVLEKELMTRPYEDFEIEFRTLAGKDATIGGMARAYRNDQLARKVVKPLRERVKTNPVLKQGVEAPEIRIRQAWKRVPSPIPDQTPENEPPVRPYVTFDRVTDIARELKRQGVKKAELCLVGWNIGGHDGRWPQAFPVEPTLGGEQRLRDCIRTVQDLGYLIVGHGNFLDAYRIADSWDEEWLCKDLNGEATATSGNWGGGLSRRICAQRAYERFTSREMPRMKALGFKGLGYFDVVSVVPAELCTDPRHPLSKADCARWWGKSAELSRRCFGGFASEGAFDHFAGSLDSALYVSFHDPRKEPNGLVDRIEMMPQLVYNGVFVMNPFTRTVNPPAQERYWQLKLVEFSGRPQFYFYSKFKTDGYWMGDGDLGCANEKELKDSVALIKKGADEYERLVHLQYEFIADHTRLAPNVYCTSYENGEKVYVNYNKTPASVDGLTLPAEGWLLK